MESSVQERHGPFGARPEEGHKNDPWNGTPLLQCQAESWDCSAWRRLWGDLRGALQYLEGSYKKEDRIFSRVCCDRTRGNDFKLKERRFRLNTGKKLSYNNGSEAPALLHRGGGCPIPGHTQGQAGWGSDRAVDVLAHCRQVGLEDL